MSETTRRDFIKTAALGAAGAWTVGTAPAAHASPGRRARRSRRPNVVVVMADDMGFSDVGCYGGEVDTPHIDGLAAEGVRFTQFYNAARCCPTRASLLTGLYPHQAGVGHMRADKGVPAYRGHLNDDCVTIAEVLRNDGYTTLMSGKWHLGKRYDQWPLARGFDRYSGLLDGASHYFDPPPNRTLVRDNEPYAPGHVGYFEPKSRIDHDFYMTDFFTEEAVRFVRDQEHTDQPFFLYLAHTAPHWPLHAPEDVIQKYEERYRVGWDVLREQRYRRLADAGLVDEMWALPERDQRVPAWKDLDEEEKERQVRRMTTYAAMIDRMDQGIGRVLDALEATGKRQDTLVLFLSDNGASAERIDADPAVPAGGPESYEGYGRPWAHLSNVPFRYYKSWVHEGGIATPLVASWPAHLGRSGSVSRRPGHVADVMATALDAAGATYPETCDGRTVTPLEGASLLPAMQGNEAPAHDALYWSHMNNHAVRQGRWKLVTKNGMQGDAWELYDLAADRSERRDLAAQQPERVRDLAASQRRWADRVGVLPWEKYRALETMP